MLSAELKNRFVTARRQLIASDFPGLNLMQLSAVLATEGPLLVLAGAGSGKTTVLIQRVANLIKYGRASDSDEVPDYAGEAETEFLERCASTGFAALEPEEREAFLNMIFETCSWKEVFAER